MERIQNYGNCRKVPQDLFCSSESVHLRHSQIEKNNVRLEQLGLLNCISAIYSFATDLPFTIGFEKFPQLLPHGQAIVGNQNARRHNS